jgi:hypothetical protein
VARSQLKISLDPFHWETLSLHCCCGIGGGAVRISSYCLIALLKFAFMCSSSAGLSGSV